MLGVRAIYFFDQQTTQCLLDFISCAECIRYVFWKVGLCQWRANFEAKMLRLLKGRPMSMSLNEAKILRLLRDRPMSMSRSQAKILRFLKGRTMSMSRSRANILRLLKGRPKSMSCEYWSKDLGSRFLLVLIRVQTALTLLEILSPHKAYKANSWAALMKSVVFH